MKRRTLLAAAALAALLCGLAAVAATTRATRTSAASVQPAPPPPDQPTPMAPPTGQPASRNAHNTTPAGAGPWGYLGPSVSTAQPTIEADGVGLAAPDAAPTVAEADALATLAQGCSITAAPVGAAYAHVTLSNGTPGGITVSQDAWVFSFAPQLFSEGARTPAWDLWFVGITDAPHGGACFGMGGGSSPA